MLDGVEYLQTIEFTRHHDVEQHHRRAMLGEHLQGAVAVGGFQHRVVLFQCQTHEATDIGVVVNDKNSPAFGADLTSGLLRHRFVRFEPLYECLAICDAVFCSNIH